MADQKIGDLMDAQGVTLPLDEGDLVTRVMVLAVVVTEDGSTTLAMGSSEGLTWIDKRGMLSAAQFIADDRSDLRRLGDDL